MIRTTDALSPRRPGCAQGDAQGVRFTKCLFPRHMPGVPRVPGVLSRACACARACLSRALSAGRGALAFHGRELLTHGTPGTPGILLFFNHLTQRQPWAIPKAYPGRRVLPLFHDKQFETGREG